MDYARPPSEKPPLDTDASPLRLRREDSSPDMVTSCRNGETALGGNVYTGSLVIRPGHQPEPWQIKSFDTLDFDSLVTLKKYKPDILLLGTGIKTRQLPGALIFSLLKNGMIIECMNNTAACGTYNLMVSEGRNPVLAVIAES